MIKPYHDRPPESRVDQPKSAAILRVRDWDKRFENNRSRDTKTLGWVPVPNRQDDDGYVQLVDHDDGAAHFGAWVAILLIASKSLRLHRGVLMRDTGKPHDAASLARCSRLPVAIFEAVIPRLIDIEWLERVPAASLPQEGAASSQAAASLPQEGAQKGREGNAGNGGNEAGGVSRSPEPEVPEQLQTSEFSAAWGQWQAHLAEVGKRLSPTTACRQLEQLAEWGPQRAAASLSEAVSRGWKSFHEPETAQPGSEANTEHEPPSRNPTEEEVALAFAGAGEGE